MDATPTPAEALRAEALTRTLATIRVRWPDISDEDADELAAMLMRFPPRSGFMRFWRRWPGHAHVAEFSLLRHPTGAEAFYASRIE